MVLVTHELSSVQIDWREALSIYISGLRHSMKPQYRHRVGYIASLEGLHAVLTGGFDR